MRAREAEVFDLGYQRYTGPREGRNRARLALFENGVRTVLGIGRGGRAKILPVGLFLAVMTPAVVFVIILAFIGEAGADFIPGPADYYSIVSVILIIFGAIMAPELLCPVRRDNVLPLYLVRPLTSTDYLIARFLAFFAIVLVLVYAGQIVLQAGLILTANDQVDYIRDNWQDVPRILFMGVLIATFISVGRWPWPRSRRDAPMPPRSSSQHGCCSTPSATGSPFRNARPKSSSRMEGPYRARWNARVLWVTSRLTSACSTWAALRTTSTIWCST